MTRRAADDHFCPVCASASAAPGRSSANAAAVPAVRTADTTVRDLLVLTGTLMTSVDSPLLPGAALLMRDGRVAAIFPNHPDHDALQAQGGGDADVLDLSAYFVMPGLIDCHVHLLFEGATGTGLEFFQKSDAHWAVDGAALALRSLSAGFTTVRDCGNLNGTPAIYALRDAFAKRQLMGPRTIAASAILSVTGGAGDMLGFRDGAVTDPAHSGIADGPWACRQAVRRQVKAGADFIKVTMTGGILSDSSAGVGQQFHDDEIKAIVDEAHHWGLKVAVHAHSAGGVNSALRAGADSIEHGTYLDDESLGLFAEREAWLVPTLLAGRTVTEMAEVEGLLPPAVRQKAREVGPDLQRNIGKAIGAGVKIAFGTDTGVSRHGDNAREFSLLVAGGMSERDAVRAATTNAAELLGLTDQIGSIGVGKAADVIAVDEDPCKRIDVLEQVHAVIKAGDIIRSPTPRA